MTIEARQKFGLRIAKDLKEKIGVRRPCEGGCWSAVYLAISAKALACKRLRKTYFRGFLRRVLARRVNYTIDRKDADESFAVCASFVAPQRQLMSLR
jgi:hypothetical protein